MIPFAFACWLTVVGAVRHQVKGLLHAHFRG